jgi:hypothetical protein
MPDRLKILRCVDEVYVSVKIDTIMTFVDAAVVKAYGTSIAHLYMDPRSQAIEIKAKQHYCIQMLL